MRAAVPKCSWILVLFWTCSTFGHIRWDWDASCRQNEAASFQSIITRCFVSPFFFFSKNGRPENDITRPTISKGENKGFLWEMQKSFNFFLTNRFSLHEILIKTDCLRWGASAVRDLHPEPLSARPLFHLRNSTLWLLSTREYLWWRCPRLSHSASVARQMLAFERDPLRDRHAPWGWRGRANYIDKHAWDSSSIRQPFQPWKLWVS